jgi:DNA replicative helicase MCM subunit Mcm2 (Cdc46/Mcm family)
MVICLASAHAKARLSHVVEAEPDCKIAMDILSLPCSYHENTGATEPAVKENEPKEAVTLVEITDEGESGEPEEPASKKQCVVDDLDEPSQELKSRLWDEIAAR